MSCRVCGNQYVNSTTESHNHNGLINDIEIIFIDKTGPSGPTRTIEFC